MGPVLQRGEDAVEIFAALVGSWMARPALHGPVNAVPVSGMGSDSSTARLISQVVGSV